ncbi:hypothetical protein BCAR13_520170 [Paraburkholderia caribensis]|nr:hypothetical protein BCAR13_520170 [Paraburkholderia caribensis]
MSVSAITRAARRMLSEARSHIKPEKPGIPPSLRNDQYGLALLGGHPQSRPHPIGYNRSVEAASNSDI